MTSKNGLPATWSEVPLADLGTWTGGGTPSKQNPALWKNGTIPWISPKDVKVERIRQTEDFITEAAVVSSATKLIPSGSVVVVTRSGILEHTLPVAMTEVQATVNQDLKALVPANGVSAAYAAWALRAAEDRILRECRKSGTTVASIEFPKLLEFKIPLAPFPEQRRIVAEIETQLSRLDAAVAALGRARANLRRYRAAVLAAATNDGEGAWPRKTIGEIADIGTGSTPLRSNQAYFQGGTLPWVTSGALNAEQVSAASAFVTEQAARDCRLRTYEPGTLLVAMYGEGKTRGKCAELRIPATINQAIAAISVRDERRHYQPFLRLFLLGQYEMMRRKASGGVQPNLNLSLIREISVPLPPDDHVDAIVAEVERRLSVVEAAEATVAANLKRAEKLRQAVLRTAFAGELVAQNPSDEPAAALLARIKAERATMAPTKPRRGRSRGAGRQQALPLG